MYIFTSTLKEDIMGSNPIRGVASRIISRLYKITSFADSASSVVQSARIKKEKNMTELKNNVRHGEYEIIFNVPILM